MALDQLDLILGLSIFLFFLAYGHGFGEIRRVFFMAYNFLFLLDKELTTGLRGGRGSQMLSTDLMQQGKLDPQDYHNQTIAD